MAGNQESSIPPGEYEAICYKAETGKSWGGRTDAYIRFRIYGGKYDGTELFMACTWHPKSKLTPRHKYLEQWTLAKGRRPVKGEPLSLTIFKGKMYRVLVRNTQRMFSDGRLKPGYMQYSVVDSILKPPTGVPGHG
ncbi:MAG: hypothetical protein ABII79_01750 [bacterium]